MNWQKLTFTTFKIVKFIYNTHIKWCSIQPVGNFWRMRSEMKPDLLIRMSLTARTGSCCQPAGAEVPQPPRKKACPPGERLRPRTANGKSTQEKAKMKKTIKMLWARTAAGVRDHLSRDGDASAD